MSDDERKEAINWLADQVIRYRRPTRILWFVITGAIFIVGAAFAFAKLAFLIYGGLLNDPNSQVCFRVLDGIRLSNGRTVHVLCAVRGGPDAP